MAKKSIFSSDFSGMMDIRCSFHSLIALLVTALIVGAVYLTTESGYLVKEDDLVLNMKKKRNNSNDSKCDLFSGKWVYDNESYPLFNATALLEKLRNKRLVFVGDSLNRGQWVSMVCLLDKVIPPGLKYMHNNGSSLITFKAKEYNARIEFYWAPLMVESNSDDPTNHRLPDRIVRAQAIEKHARHWTDADFLVFNTYLWWRRPQMKVLWGSFNSSDGIYKNVEMLRSYEMALKTWSDWLEIHINRTKTQLFFMTMSPTHERAEEWGSSKGGNCYNETEVILEEGYRGRGSDPKMMQIVEETINKLESRGLNVQMINITQLSEYRKEGHPSIYRKQWEPLTEEQISNPLGYADCIHWCLPGVPDVWNELLFNGEALLEKIRGKKLMFVGDSLGRNQWESMVCLVESTISPSSKSLIMQQKQSTLFLEYNATIEFHWSPFLIESNHDNPFQHGHSNDRILRIEAIEKHARHWTEADILVFDSYTWWLEPNVTLLWGSFGSSDAIYRNIRMRLRPYEMALRTWSDWLEFNLNRTKTKLFFMSMSPIHSRFNGRAFLEKIRGKKVVYVGDSLNRNQWQSMLCLIQSTHLPLSSKKSLISKGNFYIFQAIDYNATIAFYWSPLLVESNCDDMASHRVDDRVVRIKAIEKHARHWTDADILVFDSFLWWLEPTITILWGSFGSSDAIYKKTTMNMRRYEIALNTWSNWLEINVNRTKTKLYFMSLSPMHCRPPSVRRGEILGLEQQHCYNQTEPIFKEGYWGCPSNRGMMNIAESRLDKLQKKGLKVQYLNITQLSGYRKDAHPSIYRKFNHQISEDRLKDPESYSDCIHWCLPGVPDVWNQILYAYIMNPEKYY
ncbi:hypothetical protein RD792_013892 [Penstemon davidsonii]|uniref:Trichome birefringence-like C-terminal domain-containing protein n=1 Tax=Penstemon davidsonii TaxID=160366 RepID=A0ABR0CMU2_9LAMI|nr:hypothetical protein RD792_013892 [Penstemon davidsonii]